MKRLLCILLTLVTLLSLWACRGNFDSVDLKDPIQIPQDGVIDQNTLLQIKNENAIAVFVGTSGDFQYEWTLFCSDIAYTKEINLALSLEKTAAGDIGVTLQQAEPFGFSAALSVHLPDTWDAQSATAYTEETPFATVSITGSDHTILNLNLDATVNAFVIRPDPLPEDQNPTQDTAVTQSDLPVDTTPLTQATEPENTESPTVPTTAPTQPEKPTEPTKPTQPQGKDKYHTDPVPEGKPTPVEPEDQEVDRVQTYTCTFSIECSTILNNLNMLDPEKLEMVPSSGTILSPTTVTFYEGESVFDVLQRLCKDKGIHMESSWTPMYNSAYIEGIHNLYEFDCGDLSGWMYRVNGWYPNYGCSRYQLAQGDIVEWRFTCDLGNDIGGGYAAGG